MIAADKDKSYEIMGAAVKQSGEQFGKSASFLKWSDKEANQKFFANDLVPFMKESAVILKEAGVIRSIPENYGVMYDASFIK